MAMYVTAKFILTEDVFEQLDFNKQGDIIEGMLSHPDWDVRIEAVEMMEVNMDDDDTE